MQYPDLLGGSWVGISRGISRVTIVIAHIKGPITLPITTNEPRSKALNPKPSVGVLWSGDHPQCRTSERKARQPNAAGSFNASQAARLKAALFGLGVLGLGFRLGVYLGFIQVLLLGFGFAV